jgi:electron transfer flavoprotein beta subunit
VTDGIKWIVNPFDEIAVEEAVRLREKGLAQEIVVCTIGPKDAAAQLRSALALGADRGLLLEHNGELDSDLAARALQRVYEEAQKEGSPFDLILMGKQAIDSDRNQTAQLLAAYLDLPQACFASQIEIVDRQATVVREVDGGLETVRAPLPLVISADLRLNEPRYATLPNIMKAKKKEILEQPLEALLADTSVKLTVLKMRTPAPRGAGKRVQSVPELVELLRTEAKVLE